MACRDLLGMTDPDMSIVSAEVFPGGDGIPEHCRVNGVLAPEIRFQVNLPAAWNRRFYMNGNGGFAGESPEAPNRAALRATALRHGFVSATTNTGHDAAQEPLATFGERSYQKVVDYAFRAVHLTAVTSKTIAARYYDRPVAYSYWDGCSTGGRQALMEAQRFPGRLRRHRGRRARAELRRHADPRPLARARARRRRPSRSRRSRSSPMPSTPSATASTAWWTASSTTPGAVHSTPSRICPSAPPTRAAPDA